MPYDLSHLLQVARRADGLSLGYILPLKLLQYSTNDIGARTRTEDHGLQDGGGFAIEADGLAV